MNRGKNRAINITQNHNPRGPFLRKAGIPKDESPFPDKLSPPTKRQSVDNPPSPHRPFLRRQESHSVVNANNAKIHTHFRPPAILRPKYAHDSHSPGRPFLRRQESHSVMRATITKNPPHTPVHPQTIPAKAGISQSCAAHGGVN